MVGRGIHGPTLLPRVFLLRSLNFCPHSVLALCPHALRCSSKLNIDCDYLTRAFFTALLHPHTLRQGPEFSLARGASLGPWEALPAFCLSATLSIYCPCLLHVSVSLLISPPLPGMLLRSLFHCRLMASKEMYTLILRTHEYVVWHEYGALQIRLKD